MITNTGYAMPYDKDYKIWITSGEITGENIWINRKIFSFYLPFFLIPVAVCFIKWQIHGVFQSSALNLA